jgi:sensor c-di-GMP phosphodiesterase-like protein
VLYSTRCSKRFPTCTTAYKSIPEIIGQERTSELLDSGLGGLVGMAFCTIWSAGSRRSRSMEHQLRRAIKRDSFRMAYQPLVDISTGHVVGAEALIRWDDEQGAPVSPDVFIALAEELGIICEITRLVVRHVLEDIGETLIRYPEFRLSINVSAADLLDPAFSPSLKTALRDAGVSTSSLAIEVTERCMAKGAAISEAVRTLRIAGFSVHLDDFGTGYSSLSCLQELEIDAIKIDRAFIHAIGTGSVAQGILQQILGIASYLNLEVILEGVETREQVDYFAAIGKPLVGQGWYFGRPGPAADIKYALSIQRSRPHTEAPAPMNHLKPELVVVQKRFGHGL